MPQEYRSNPGLKTILPGWQGTPLDVQGRFVNHEYPFWPRTSDLWKWVRGPKPQKAAKKKDTYRPAIEREAGFLLNDKDCIVWLGHASFFIRLSGITFLTDPLFYKIPMTKRLSPFPFDPSVFKNIDYLVISHDHRDHCQKQSIKLLARNNPKMKILSGLNMTSLLSKYSDGLRVQEAGWYQQYNLPKSPVEVFFLPSRHWSRRRFSDTNMRLWGALVFKSQNHTIYFSGDTGYGRHLKQAGDLFPDIDICIVGIGAFRPEWFMSPNHISPRNAVRACNEIGADHFIPMHYGTLDLSDEPPGEPIEMVRNLKENGKLKADLREQAIGETWYLANSKNISD